MALLGIIAGHARSGNDAGTVSYLARGLKKFRERIYFRVHPAHRPGKPTDNCFIGWS
jgi:hypothetical protein